MASGPSEASQGRASQPWPPERVLTRQQVSPSAAPAVALLYAHSVSFYPAHTKWPKLGIRSSQAGQWTSDHRASASGQRAGLHLPPTSGMAAGQEMDPVGNSL